MRAWLLQLSMRTATLLCLLCSMQLVTPRICCLQFWQHFFILRAYFDIYCCQLTSAIKYVATVHTQLIAGQMATCQRCCHALKQCQSHNFFTLPSLFTHFSRLQSCHLSSLSAATVWHCCYNFLAVVFFAFVCNATIATVVSVSVCHDLLCRCHRF